MLANWLLHHDTELTHLDISRN